MESINAFKLEESRRLIKWISENYDDWKKIVYSNVREMPDEYPLYFKLLKENQFYDILIMYIFMNRDIIPTYNFLEALGMQHLAENWDYAMFEHLESFIMKKADI